MKTVIYHCEDVYYTTTEKNYKSRIQNARLIHRMDGFYNPAEIIAYFCKYYNANPDDFIII